MGNINTTERRMHLGRVNPSKVITQDFMEYTNKCCGNVFRCQDNTADIGAETTPADTIEIYFTTPAATTADIHAEFSGFCSTAGAIFKIEEGYAAGGGASGDAATIYCLNRKRNTTSKITDMKIQADTITSGGTVLLTQTMATGSKVVGEDIPWVLKAETKYSVSVKLAGAGVAWVAINWHEV